MNEEMYMSEQEWDRYKVLQQVKKKQLTQVEAASLLGISDRQVRNILYAMKLHGKKAVISRRKNQPSNNRIDETTKQVVISLLVNKYEGFGPTLACEKLKETHHIDISKETLRQWMIEAKVWSPKNKKKKIHVPRNRRPCFGELIQADGSHHKWLGDNKPAINLTVFIDDATSRLTSLLFSEEETLDSYFSSLEQHMKQYGRPRALYTDRYTVFCSPAENGTTQMQQALKKLDIKLILANSPQAKGRVERANRTLQDRLLKELRLRNIVTIEEANKFAKEFIDKYNKQFSKEPMNSFDAHQPLEGYDLERILCRSETRTLLSDCTFQFNKRIFMVQDILDVRRAKGRKIEVRLLRDGRMKVFFEDKELTVKSLCEVESPLILSRKEALSWKTPGAKSVPQSHPWKRGYKPGNSKKNVRLI